MSTALPSEKVEAAIDRLREDLRRQARRWFHRTIEDPNNKRHRKPYPYRHGSESFPTRFPNLAEYAVTPDQREFMYNLKQEGCSFREIEEIMHLRPNSGNDAQRCINKHMETLSANGKLKAKPKAKGRVSRAQVNTIVKSYLEQADPLKAKAIYKQVVAIIPNETARRKNARVAATV